MTIALKGIWTEFLNLFGKAWWIEISTTLPNVNYYFGPFATFQAAQSSIEIYMENLQEKSDHVSKPTIKRCKPEGLYINCEIAENSDGNSLVSLP